ncbi:hypothetical protein [Sphaerothrix gracilis]|uniref:hypothetical protein n=1 Tax=Sphaerothrix gracilis TaxID=3151835 RepID=UPI0031FC7E95
MVLDELWNDFLKKIAYDYELPKAPTEKLLLRFSYQNLEVFSKYGDEKALEKLDPDDPNSLTNFKRNMTKVYQIFDAEVTYKSENNKFPDLFDYLYLKCCDWRSQLGIPSGSEFQIVPEQHLDECLHQLDYDKQSQAFRDTLRHGTVKAFLVRADDPRIQKWLAKRLFLKIPSYEIAERYPLEISTTLRRNFDEFWISLAQKLNVSTVDGSTVERIAIFQALCDRARTKPFVMVVYGIDGLRRNLKLFFEEFWQPLQAQMSETPCLLKGCFVLILTESASYTCPYSDCVVELPPLRSIEAADITFWLRLQAVSKLLQDRSTKPYEEQVDLLTSDSSPPLYKLEDICDAFGQIDIAQMLPYWNLAG